ncbi:2048_t:CDS:1, partial [Gigaspora rosea]
MEKERTGKEALSYLLNEHVKYLNRYMKRLEVSESKPILLDFVRNEIEVTKRDKEKIDTDFIK